MRNLLFGLAIAAGTASPACALSLAPLYHSVYLRPEMRRADFTLEFNQIPDWSRQTFRFFVIGHPELGYPRQFDSLIDGVRRDSLIVRNGWPHVTPGGWGRVRAVLHFSQADSIVTFSASYDDILHGDVDPEFLYWIETYEGSGSTSFGEGRAVVPVAEPATLRLCVLGLLILVGGGSRRTGRLQGSRACSGGCQA